MDLAQVYTSASLVHPNLHHLLDQVQVPLPPLDQPCSPELDLVMLALILDLNHTCRDPNHTYLDLVPPHPSFTRAPTTRQW